MNPVVLHSTTPWPAVALVFNALVWGLVWWPMRELLGHGLHPLWANAVVYALVLVALLLWRPQALQQLRRQPELWVLALAAGLTNALFNWGVSIGEVVRVVLLFYLMPLWMLVLARLLLGELFTGGAVLRVLLALSGAWIVLQREGAGWPQPSGLADWLGLLAGMAFAVNSVVIRRIGAHTEPEGRTTAMAVGCLLVALVLATVLGVHGSGSPLPPFEPRWLLLVLALALAFVTANLCYQYGAARLPASVTAVVMLTELLFAAVSAVWIGGETLDAQMLVGGALIVTASLLAALAKPPATRPAPG